MQNLNSLKYTEMINPQPSILHDDHSGVIYHQKTHWLWRETGIALVKDEEEEESAYRKKFESEQLL